MSHPTPDKIAVELGLPSRLVPLLRARGMPVATVRKARTWWERSGLTYSGGKIVKVGKTP